MNSLDSVFLIERAFLLKNIYPWEEILVLFIPISLTLIYYPFLISKIGWEVLLQLKVVSVLEQVAGGGHTTLAELAVVRRRGVPMAAARPPASTVYYR